MKNWIKKRPLITFFILTYLISWVCWIPLIFVDGMDEDLAFIVMLLGVLGPPIAAIIVSKTTGTFKEFIASTFKVKVDFVWWFFALVLPITASLIVHAISPLIGVGVFSEADIMSATTFPLYYYPLMLLFMIFVGGGLEEPGWRGFAQIRLLERFNPFVTSILLGIIWTYWHAPLFFVPISAQQNLPIGWYTLEVTALAIILTWLFIRSRGSAFLAIIFHGGVNAVGNWNPSYYITPSGNEISFFTPLAMVMATIALIIIVLERQYFFHTKRWKEIMK